MSYAQNRDVLESTTSYATIWRETEWNKVKRYVNKQRYRIFRAESEGNSRKVRDLQRMLVRSPAALKLAIQSKSDYFKKRYFSTTKCRR